jgi:hypothetical protein
MLKSLHHYKCDIFNYDIRKKLHNINSVVGIPCEGQNQT